MEAIRPDLKLFIRDFCKEQKIKNIEIDILDIDSNIETELNIFDIDADLFITNFVKKFNVDYSQFDWSKYGYPVGSPMVSIVSFFLGRKSSFTQRLSEKYKHSTFTIRVLQDALNTGKLV